MTVQPAEAVLEKGDQEVKGEKRVNYSNKTTSKSFYVRLS